MLRTPRRPPVESFWRSLLATFVGLGTTGGRTTEPLRLDQGVLDGAPYTISVPPQWNGALVVFAHGYQAEGPGNGAAFPEPLADYLTKLGYAWAVSGYRSASTMWRRRTRSAGSILQLRAPNDLLPEVAA